MKKTNNWRKYDQDNEIEQWVTDAFYSYFPSFSERREEKARELKINRQKEYNDYLKSMPEPISKRDKLNLLKGQEASLLKKENFTTDTESQDSQSVQVIKKIKKTELPIVLNINMTDKGLQKPKENKYKTKLYQQQLINKIAKKKKDLEKLEEKELEEEDKYIRHLENQMALLELEEQYIRRRRSIEKAKLLVKLDNQKHMTEIPKEDSIVNSNAQQFSLPKKPYSFFTNSSKHSTSNSNSNDLASKEASTDDDLIVLPDINRYQYCKKCRSDIDSSYFSLLSDDNKKPLMPNKLVDKNETQQNLKLNNKHEKFCSDCSESCRKLKNYETVPHHSDNDGNISDVVFGKKIDLVAPIKTPNLRYESQRLPKMVVNEQNTFKPIIFLPASKKMISTKKTMLPQRKIIPKPVQTFTEVGAFSKQLRPIKLSASD